MGRTDTFKVLVLFSCFYQVLSQFICYDCTGGSQTNCGNILSRDMVVNCQTQCYEAYIEYQNGAIPLLQRRCWNKPNNTNAGTFCDWFPTSKSAINSNAKLISCRTCTSNRCNGNTDLVKTTIRPIVTQCT